MELLRMKMKLQSNRSFLYSALSILISCFFLGCNTELNHQPSTQEISPASDAASSDRETEPLKPEPNPHNDLPQVENSLVIGLSADMSSGSSQAGVAIMRGATLAINDINSKGGMLGRPLELVVRDHRGNPDRGIDNMIEFAEMKDVIAVLGGLHTPVALRELPTIHQREMIYLSPWAAGTPVVENGYSPNFVFRVSVRDEYAGGFLVNHALNRGFRKIGLLLERTGWGRSNEIAIKDAIAVRSQNPPKIEWFNLGEVEMNSQLGRLLAADVDCVLLVSNPLEGQTTLKAMAAVEKDKRVPIISHWGITGGNFAELAKEELTKVDFSFLQTHSFIEPRRKEKSNLLFEKYKRLYPECESPRDIFSPAGTAHAFEAVMLLAEGIKKANSSDRPAIRNALENLKSYDGIIRNYDPPFSATKHDALTEDDFIIAKYGEDGAIEPKIRNTSVAVE